MTAPVFFLNTRPVHAGERHRCARILDGIELGWRVTGVLWAENERHGR